jgi:hypothetical protein
MSLSSESEHGRYTHLPFTRQPLKLAQLEGQGSHFAEADFSGALADGSAASRALHQQVFHLNIQSAPESSTAKILPHILIG